MYYDLLVKIKNAASARKKLIRVPYANLDFAVAKILASRGYLKDVKRKVIDKKGFMEIELLSPQSEDAIRGVKFVSKPSCRVYVGYRDLKPVRQGRGLAVISTPKGVMTNNEARKSKLGGEYLFEIW
ncbi:MAG: 30S ribosomal protein S8 [Parcubacteria group bacterium GW2011_GWA1_50_14]|uniref:Small ribosomal subunit protein uS8 n=1 Tax=Candidatus Liptonbacteria bacterium GWB1_49_6 TaxID=1798644 RepID=A0A1G2C6D1_9BACT|nr:MAG: 30S ribosomal protein S8 [Parcubacteria group bacterium GW2011_GWA1_50_14]OGY96935.1 MAG: 30S ribosomal protein S8 [Candidatus Liptonbacteria bacterium GWB1_49_6]